MLLETKVIGNIGNDAEIKTFDNGGSLIKFSVAHTEKWKQGDEWKSRTTWVTCNYFRTKDQSLKIADYLKKGKLVYVSGEPSARGWNNPQGEAQAALEVRVHQVQLLSKNESEGTEQTQTPAATSTQSTANTKPGEEDDLPF